MNLPQIKLIPVKNIKNNLVGKIRELHEESQEFKNLISSMEDNGYDATKPVLVRPMFDKVQGVKIPDMYSMVDGQHRHAAAERAFGVDFLIPTIVDESLTEDDQTAALRMYQGNQFVPTTVKERADHLKKFASDNPTMTYEDIAKKHGIHRTQIGAYLKFDRLVPEAEALINKGKIPMTKALILATVPPEFQPQFIEDAVNMASNDFTKKVQEYRKEFKVKRARGEVTLEDKVIPKFIGLTEAKIKLEQAKRALAAANPDDVGEYRYLTGRKDMLEEILQVDAHTIAYAEAKREQEKLEKQIAARKKRQEEQNQAIADLEKRKAQLHSDDEAVASMSIA